MKKTINSMERAAAAHEAERLMADAPDRVAHYKFEIDIIAHLKRIYYFTKRIARVSVPEAEKAGMTEDYHEPSDSVEKTSKELMEKIARLTYLTAFSLADQ